MKNYALSLLLLVLAGPLQAQLYTSPLPALEGDHDIRIDEVNLPPGATTPTHRHDAHVYVYVVSGTLEMQVEGAELQRLQAGEVFVETPDDVHLVLRNPSTTEAARFVSFIIKPAGASGFTLAGHREP